MEIKVRTGKIYAYIWSYVRRVDTVGENRGDKSATFVTHIARVFVAKIDRQHLIYNYGSSGAANTVVGNVDG